MNKGEAHKILLKELACYRSQSYGELTKLIGSPLNIERRTESCAYQIEIQAFWDEPHQPKGNIRIIGSIDNGKFFSALKPLSIDFIKTPGGDFVGE